MKKITNGYICEKANENIMDVHIINAIGKNKFEIIKYNGDIIKYDIKKNIKELIYIDR